MSKKTLDVCRLCFILNFCVLSAHAFIPPIRIPHRPTQSVLLSLQRLDEVTIREWQPGDGPRILEILRKGQPKDMFNPEGVLSLDCTSEDLLTESYSTEDGGCFVVAILEGSSGGDPTMVGTAGLIVGTPVQYQVSGASQSSGDLTAAIRRCTLLSEELGPEQSANVVRDLFLCLEDKAVRAEATQIIALAYPNKEMQPSPTLLEGLEYQRLDIQIPGVDAIQYGKTLSPRSRRDDSSSSAMPKSEGNPVSDAMFSSGIAVAILGLLLSGILGIAGLFGFDTSFALVSGLDASSDTAINRGLGQPLSQEDLSQLLKDEQLKRAALDGKYSSNSPSREWQELSLEEKREELALLQVVSGKDLRLK